MAGVFRFGLSIILYYNTVVWPCVLMLPQDRLVVPSFCDFLLSDKKRRYFRVLWLSFLCWGRSRCPLVLSSQWFVVTFVHPLASRLSGCFWCRLPAASGVIPIFFLSLSGQSSYGPSILPVRVHAVSCLTSSVCTALDAVLRETCETGIFFFFFVSGGAA